MQATVHTFDPAAGTAAALSGFLLRAAALRWGWTLPGFPTHARRV